MTATLRYRGNKPNIIELAKNLDAFKKIPKKYTEPTEIGGTGKANKTFLNHIQSSKTFICFPFPPNYMVI